ncbi:MAG: AmmeMemoRadiSam system radical SAM enzyme [bacterium]|nr:AmmeMemoRadiSam system radical SAM enzyme [bacterium]
MKEAMFYDKGPGKTVNCRLCSHRCEIKEGKRGICAVRENRHGILYSLVYGKLISQGVDPIEKKPLFHFLPGSFSFSIATVGCNFRCRHCQNATIAQMPRDLHQIIGEEVAPPAIVEAALRQNCQSISYTYTEPTIFFEYAYDTARRARGAGLRNVFVSNGYMTGDAADCIAPYLDAINIDLKGLDPFYKKICGARLQPVVDSIRHMHRLGVWVEVTTLVIPEENDSNETLENLAEIIAEVDPSIPWHISAFQPSYQMTDKPRTPAATIERARAIGIKAGLEYVYVGNLPLPDGETTMCPQCDERVVERIGYSVIQEQLVDGQCGRCRHEINGVWA